MSRFESAGSGGHASQLKTITTYALMGIGAIIGLSVILGTWFTVSENERGVRLRNGAFYSVVQPGLNFKLPWFDSVVTVDMQTHTYQWEKMEAYSADQQPAMLKVSVTLHITPGKEREFYQQFGGDYKAAIARIIAPAAAQQTKIVFGQYNAERAIRSREQLNVDAFNAFNNSVGQSIFTIERVRIEDISWSGPYLASIEQRMQAEVEVQRYHQTLQREKIQAQIKVTQAQGIADSLVAQATAEAKAIQMKGEAEALAIKARGDALAQNPALVHLVQSERWDGKQPQFIMIGGGSGPVPLLNIGTPTMPAIPTPPRAQAR